MARAFALAPWIVTACFHAPDECTHDVDDPDRHPLYRDVLAALGVDDETHAIVRETTLLRDEMPELEEAPSPLVDDLLAGADAAYFIDGDALDAPAGIEVVSYLEFHAALQAPAVPIPAERPLTYAYRFSPVGRDCDHALVYVVENCTAGVSCFEGRLAYFELDDGDWSLSHVEMFLQY